MANKKILLVLPLILAAIIMYGYAIQYANRDNRDEEVLEVTETTQASPTAEATDSAAETTQPSFVFEAAADGQTALEVLQENAEIDFEESELGIFVTSINSIAGNDDYYWAFYVNGEYARKGVADTVLNTGDLIEFKYEKIEF